MNEEPGSSDRAISLATLAAALAALASIGLAALAGSPYLSGGRVNGWVIVFAAAFLGLLVAIPFTLERRLRERQADRDKRWETATLIWGAFAALVLALSLLVGAGSGFSGSSLAGTIGLIAALESGILVLAVGAWLLAS